MINELSSMIRLFDQADALVTPIYLSLWKRFGVNESMIQQELDQSLRETEAKYGGL